MIRTVIVEDEQNALAYLTHLLQTHCPEVQVSGTATTVADAVGILEKSQPDLVLMDVELQGDLSFAIFGKLTVAPTFEVIFTTAHNKYAIQAIKFSCLEYLLKPIEPQELIDSIEKFKHRKRVSINQKQIELLIQHSGNTPDKFQKIAIPSQDGFLLVKIADIVFCESDGNYTWIHTIQGEKILSSRNLSSFMDRLPEETFFRCHKSTLINLNYIKKYSKTEGYKVFMDGGHWLDIAQRKKDEFLQRIGTV